MAIRLKAVSMPGAVFRSGGEGRPGYSFACNHLGSTHARGNGGGQPKAPRNVLGDQLEDCSAKPLTGFFRDGCCNKRVQAAPRSLASGFPCRRRVVQVYWLPSVRLNDLTRNTRWLDGAISNSTNKPKRFWFAATCPRNTLACFPLIKNVNF